jgi:hypothetical protein
MRRNRGWAEENQTLPSSAQLSQATRIDDMCSGCKRDLRGSKAKLQIGERGLVSANLVHLPPNFPQLGKI